MNRNVGNLPCVETDAKCAITLLLHPCFSLHGCKPTTLFQNGRVFFKKGAYVQIHAMEYSNQTTFILAAGAFKNVYPEKI